MRAILRRERAVGSEPPAAANPAPPAEEIPALRFAPPGHFYSPLPDLEEVARRGAELFKSSVRSIPGVELNEAAQLTLLERFRGFYSEQPFTPQRSSARRYHFENPMYSYSDALFLYFMLRHLQPRRVIEVGSGYSSCVTLDTSELFLQGSVKCTFIEPFPDRLLGLLRPGDKDRVEVLTSPLQQLASARFSELGANDILFIDSTHVSKIGSDVNRLLFEVLPSLSPGVYVHIHDIFYPFEYPRTWIEEGRAWNEAYLLRAFLQYNSAFEIVLFTSFLHQRHPQLLAELFPLSTRNPGASLWIRRRLPAGDGQCAPEELTHPTRGP
jgi:hypothetical protein